MNLSNELANELIKLTSAANKTLENIKYKHLKHTEYCKFRFETTGWYDCFQTDYNANIAFDVHKRCVPDPTPCHVKKNGIACGRIVTHTHRMPDGSTHTYYEAEEFNIRNQWVLDPQNYQNDPQND